MNKVNVHSISQKERRSPKGKYQARYQEISVALGRNRDSLNLRKRHPFDLTLVHIPPGGTYCPYHSHSAETELYLVVSGRGTVRDNSGHTEVVAGDAFVFHPMEPHQLSNQGTEDLVYYVIADNPIGDSCYYPDSGKWAVVDNDDYNIISGKAAGYFDREE